MKIVFLILTLCVLATFYFLIYRKYGNKKLLLGIWYTKECINKQFERRQAQLIQICVNAAIKKVGRATVASVKAAANTEKAIKNVAATKRQFKLNIKSFALGIVGWAVNES